MRRMSSVGGAVISSIDTAKNTALPGRIRAGTLVVACALALVMSACPAPPHDTGTESTGSGPESTGSTSSGSDGGGFPFTGEITIYHNPALVEITGLHSLTQLLALNIINCDALADLSGPQGEIVGLDGAGWSIGPWTTARSPTSTGWRRS